MSNKNKTIRGAFFGGGQPDPPKRVPDNLHSRSFATIQDLISEGEIEGFATASKEGHTKGTTAYDNASLKDVFLDNTPILDPKANSSDPEKKYLHFKDVSFKSKFGTSNQTAMSGIPNIDEFRTPVGVGVDVEKGSPVIRNITTPNVDAVVVTLTWPALQIFKNNGDIVGSEVEYRIQIRLDNGNYVDQIGGDDGIAKIKGRSADPYARDHRITIGSYTSSFDIKVIRETNNSPKSTKQNKFQFTSYQEVFDVSNTYPDSAYVGLRFDSKEFSRVPRRKYRIRGIKVRIPGAGANSSGTPTVVSTQAQATALGLGTVSSFGFIHYPDGYIFNGVMGAAQWTTCPAMILLDLLTNKRYGFGDHISPNFDLDSPSDTDLYQNLDLFSYVAASKYANALIDNLTDTGVKEPRFSCNVNIQSPRKAFDVINELSGVMRCMPIWSAGSVSISQDKPATAGYLFNLTNVGEAGFSYSGSSLKQRHAIFSVSYLNMDSSEVDFEVIGDSDSAEDQARRDKLGTAIKKIKAFACTSRGQAARLGRAMMFAEEQQSEVVTFSTSLDAGVVVRPGTVIDINDPVRSGRRRGGRVVAATTTSITIDEEGSTTLTTTDSNGNITSAPGFPNPPTISVILSDGTVETKTITANSSGVLSLDSALSSAPLANSPYVISSTTLATQQFRVVNVEEKDEINYAITAITYINGKYDFIETGKALPERKITTLNDPVSPPSNLKIEEKQVVINNVAHSKLFVTWQPEKGVAQYQVNYRYDNGNFISVDVQSSVFEILDNQVGLYEFEVRSYNSALVLSTELTAGEIDAEGKFGEPEDVTGLSLEPINEQFVRLKFTQATAVDVLHGGLVYVRHTNQTGGGATFSSSQDVIEAVAGNATEVIAPALAGTYLLKFQDDSGVFSVNAASVNLSLVDVADSITVKEDREDDDTPAFNNTTSSLFTNTQYSSDRGGLILTDPTAVISGTYSQATNSTTITCTINSHGLSQGEFLNFTFTSGDAVDGKFFITSVTNANVFVITAKKSLEDGDNVFEEIIHTGDVSVDRGLRGTYDFLNTLDLEGVFSLSLKRHFQGAGFFPTGLFDDRTGLVNDWPDWDGAVAESANAKLSVRTTSDNPNSSPTYSTFNDLTNGTFKGRGFQFRATLETGDSGQNMLIQQLGYTASMLSRTEQSSKITSGLGAKTVTFAAPFFVGTSSITGIPKPSVSISPQNMATGDFYELNDNNISGTQFIVHFKNSSGGNISRDFTYTAVGFGKGG